MAPTSAQPRSSLDDYLAKRDFEATPEPVGHGEVDASERPRFVVQEHDATAMHWDLRLERDGVLVSWAVPKGVPLEPGVTRLAVRTEDHPLEYLGFEGEIPAGSYGAGRMRIADSGTYACEKFHEREVSVRLEGEHLRGRYVLVRTPGAPGDRREQWLLQRLDPPLDPTRLAMPERVRPMLATSGPMPTDAGEWGFEVRWDGLRAIGLVAAGRLRLAAGRDGADLTGRFPELARLGRELAAHEAVLDGEVVAFDREGRPDRARLRTRAEGSASASTARTRARTTPVEYVVHDLLQLDGRDLRAQPYATRRRLLGALVARGAHWQVPAHHVGEGAALVVAARELGLPGVVAKRLDSPYVEGRRSDDWIDIVEEEARG